MRCGGLRTIGKQRHSTRPVQPDVTTGKKGRRGVDLGGGDGPRNAKKECSNFSA